MTFTNTT